MSRDDERYLSLHVVYRQFDMLYNLSRSKTTVGEKFVILENRLSRKLAYKGLREFPIPIFEINMVGNLQSGTFIKNPIR